MTLPAASQTALAFATALVGGEFHAAHAMLAPELHETLTASALEKKLEQMVAYSGQSALGASVSVDSEMENWPEKQPDDAGWAYVSIFRDSPDGAFAEAVTVIVNDKGLIRDIVWGRP